MKNKRSILFSRFGYVVAFIILTAAVVVTIIRMALPEIANYRTEIQAWLNAQMDYQLVIGDINAEWQGWSPQLYLEKVELYTPDHKTLVGEFDSAHVGLDLLSSLGRQEFTPYGLTISGIDLELTRNADGSVSINNTVNSDTADSEDANISSWLLKQTYIKLEKVNLVWHDKQKNKTKLRFTDAQLELATSNNRMNINSHLPLTEDTGTLSAKMEVIGNILTPNWEGSIYLEGNKIKSEVLLTNFDINFLVGSTSFKIWTHWKKSKLIDIRSKLEYSDMSFLNAKHDLSIVAIKLDLFAERKKKKNWQIEVGIKKLQTEHGNWSESKLKILVINETDRKRYIGSIDYMGLQEIVPFFVVMNLIPKATLDMFDWRFLKGDLENISFAYDPATLNDSRLTLSTDFKKLDLISSDQQYAIYNVAGSMQINDDELKLKLNSNAAKIDLPGIYANGLTLTRLNADVSLLNGDVTELLINNIDVSDNKLSITSSGKINFRPQTSPFVDIVMHINETDINSLPNYLPQTVPLELKQWFTRAMIGGRLQHGDLSFNGYLSDFPFSDTDGSFYAVFKIENASLAYEIGWPSINDVAAEITLENDNLNLSSKHAYIFDAFIDDLDLSINNLSDDADPVATIRTKVSGHSSDVTRFIKRSPLGEEQSLVELLENISGDVKLKLGLDMPIGPALPSIDGVISFANTTIKSGVSDEFSLKKLNGDVYFTRNFIWASDINALYQDHPVTLTIPKFDPYGSEFQSYVIAGQADDELFIKELMHFFPDLLDEDMNFNELISGYSNWSVKVKSSTKTAISEIEFKSDLDGLTVELPYPLAKTASERSPLSVVTILDGSSLESIRASYANNVYADFMFDGSQEEPTIKSILLGFGEPHPAIQTTNYLSVQGKLKELNVESWNDYINFNTDDQNTQSVEGSLFIEQMSLLNSQINNINIDLSSLDSGLQILLDSDELKGHVKVTTVVHHGLQVDLEKFRLSLANNNDEKLVIDKLPELDIKVDDFWFNQKNLGKLDLQTSHIASGISIDKLNMSKPGLNIGASGKWTYVDGVNHSSFKTTLEADTIGDMFKTFGFSTVSIKEGKTNITMNANWLDTPMNFSIEKITGELDINIGKGRLLDVEPSAGRLFGLLSIQTLPRRLSLDFTDLFGEGFSFDNINGKFELKHGDAHTDKLELVGPSADIIIAGRTGLLTKDYDQFAVVTPKITSGLPLASAVFGPVGIGVGTAIYLADKFFDEIPRIDNILTQQYSITGDWDDPNIEKITGENKQAPLEEQVSPGN